MSTRENIRLIARAPFISSPLLSKGEHFQVYALIQNLGADSPYEILN